MQGLPIVLVNHCHPDMPHVCGLRFRSFAEALSKRGHRVVLLVEGSEALGASPPPNVLVQQLQAHDWGRPFVLSTMPIPKPFLEKARRGQLYGLFGKGLLAAHFFLKEGPFTDWVAGSRPFWPIIAEHFRPKAIWGTFGNTGALIIARELAKTCGCVWGADFKDSWGFFIPAVFRKTLARRFAEADFFTALSDSNAAEVETYFARNAQTIYSGISEAFLEREDEEDRLGEFRVVLTGGLYGEGNFFTLVEGIGDWLRTRAGGKEVSLTYFGTDQSRFIEGAECLRDLCRVDARGFVGLDVLQEETRRATVNAYVRCGRGKFHHKVFELLAANRPIICVPGEVDEARRIVLGVDGVMHECATAQSVSDALEKVRAMKDEMGPVNRSRLAVYTWDAQAEILENLISRAVSEADK